MKKEKLYICEMKNHPDCQGSNNRCDQYTPHEKNLCCKTPGWCKSISKECACIPYSPKPKKWESIECLVLTQLSSINEPNDNYKFQQFFTWQEIADIINKKFKTNRTANACRKKYEKG